MRVPCQMGKPLTCLKGRLIARERVVGYSLGYHTTTTDTPPRPISFATAKALIRRTITEPRLNRSRTVMVHENFSLKPDCIAASNRLDIVLLARLLSKHTPLLKEYAHLIDLAPDPTCLLCIEEPQNIEYYRLRCPNLDALRQRTFRSPSPLFGVPALVSTSSRCRRSLGLPATALCAALTTTPAIVAISSIWPLR